MESMGRDHTRHLMFFYLTFKPKKCFQPTLFLLSLVVGLNLGAYACSGSTLLLSLAISTAFNVLKNSD